MADSRIHRIAGYDPALDALRHKDLVQGMYNECPELMERVLLTLHGEAHTRRRNIELRIFKRDFIRYYENEVYPRNLADTLAPYRGLGRMNLLEFAYRVNMNLTADFAGIDVDRQDVNQVETLLALVKKFSEGATLFHSTRDRDTVRAEVHEAMRTFDEVFFQPSKARREALVGAHRGGELGEESLPRDILTVLLLNAEDGDSEIDEAMMRREVGFFLQAGAHSTGNSMVHAFHEITSWCERHPEDRERLERDPVFLQRCVHESMRLHPASPVAWREAGCPLALPGGIQAAAGDAVTIDLMSANTDRAVYGEDAADYNPHREALRRCPPYALTFGLGVHTCFGRDLAGGEIPREDTDPETHRPGTVTKLVRALFALDARPDPSDPPRRDPDTQRNNWGHYPVILHRPDAP
jgi:cytochrome P450